MKTISSSHKSLSSALLPLLLPVTTLSLLLAGSILPVRADRVRTCQNYGVVRDRSDHEVPLLPRNSIASCARSYQTLYQTYRVQPAPDAAVQHHQSQLDHSTSLQPNPKPANESSQLQPASPAGDQSNHTLEQ